MYKEPTQKRHKPSEQSLSGEIEIVAKALQARLEEHDKNRKTVQESYQKHFMKKTQRINDLKERLIKKLEDETTTKVDALQNILGKILQSKKGSDELGKLLQKAKEELSTKWSFSVKFYYRNINGQYEIVAEEEVIGVAKIESKEGAVDALNKRIDSYDKNRLDLQEEIHIIIERLRTEANQLREKFSMNLEEEFKKEDSRIQKALTKLRKSGGNYISKAKNALSIKQFYEFAYMEELKTKKEIACEWLDLSKVANLKLITIKDNRAYFTREVFSDLMQLLCQNGLENSISYKAFLQKESCRNDEGKEFDVTIPYLCLTFDYLEPERTSLQLQLSM